MITLFTVIVLVFFHDCSRIVISCFLFSCAHIRAYHLRLLIDVYSFILIWLRGEQGKQLVHIIFVSLSFVNSLSSRSA